MFGVTINVAKLMERLIPGGQVKLPIGVLRFDGPPRFTISDRHGDHVKVMFDEECRPQLIIDGPGFLDATICVRGFDVDLAAKWVRLDVAGPDPTINLEW